MGWSYCGTDSEGRHIGYGIGAKCDHPQCNRIIDRGLAYACGGWHGACEVSCEHYFCETHKSNYVHTTHGITTICDECAKSLIESGDWIEDEFEGLIVRKQETCDE